MSVPTLQTIADLAGVSRSTVSMALRNLPSLSIKTRERIKQIAEEIGYRPNPLISTLMTHLRTTKPISDQGTIAFITRFDTRDGWRRVRNFERFYLGAFDRAQRNGYRLEEFWLKEPRMTSAKFCKILHSRGIRGAVFAPLQGRGGHLSLDITGLAAVTYGLSIKRPQLHRVDNHQIESIRTALRELRKCGYKRIGLALQKADDQHVNHNWTLGYLDYLFNRKFATLIRIYEPEQATKDSFIDWVREMRPDAIISVNSFCLDWLREEFAIPNQIGFALLDRSDLDVGIAGVDGRPELTGAAAIDLLLGQIHRNENGIPSAAKLILMEGVWVDGETVRKVN